MEPRLSRRRLCDSHGTQVKLVRGAPSPPPGPSPSRSRRLRHSTTTRPTEMCPLFTPGGPPPCRLSASRGTSTTVSRALGGGPWLFFSSVTTKGRDPNTEGGT